MPRPMAGTDMLRTDSDTSPRVPPAGFSDPYCMLGIQPAVQAPLPGSPRDVYGLAQGSPPPDSPRNRHFSGVSSPVVSLSSEESVSLPCTVGVFLYVI